MGQVVSCLGNSSGKALLQAAAGGQHETVRELLEVKPQLAAYAGFGNNWNCLHHAAANGHIRVLEAVIESLKVATKEIPTDDDMLGPKAVIGWGRFVKEVMNQRAVTGATPMMVACEQGHGFCAHYLVGQGADPFISDRSLKRSALHYAAANGRADALARLLAEDTKIYTEDGYQSLKRARIQDVSGNCRYIDSRGENGLTALHLAAYSGSLECIRILLDAGASMMVRTVDLDMQTPVTLPAGSTPLHAAAMNGHVAILQAMMQAHADALGTWSNGRSAEPARRAWEGDGRIDLRSVTNCLRQLPYHVAWARGFRQAAGVLNPTVPIDTALESCREMGQGFGPQKLATLAAYSLRQTLLVWLKTFQAEKEAKQRMLTARAAVRAPVRASSPSPKAAAELVPAPAGAQTASGGTSVGASLAAIVSPFAALRMDPLQEGDEASQGSPMRPGQPTRVGPQGSTAAPAGFIAAPVSSGLAGLAALTAQVQRQSPAVSPFATFGESSDNHMPDFEPPRGTAAPRRAPPAAPAGEAAAGHAATAAAAAQLLTSGAGWRATAQGNVAGVDGPAGIAGSIQAVRQYSSPADLLAAEQAAAVSGPSRQASGATRQPSRANLLSVNRAASCLVPGAGLDEPPLPMPGAAEEPGLQRVPSAMEPVMRQPSGVKRALSSISRRRMSKPGPEATKSRKSIEAWRAASIRGFDDECEDMDCGICLDAPDEVAINGCSHMMCCSCAISLCEVHKKPPLCPFCRCMIAGFHIPENPVDGALPKIVL